MKKEKHLFELVYSEEDKRTVPVYEIVGDEPGPTLCLVAAQHGCELNGVEVIRQICEEFELSGLKGRIIGIPIANPFSMANRTNGYPDDAYWYELNSESKKDKNNASKETNINRMWPGEPNGEGLAYCAHQLWDRWIKQSDFVVDFHCMDLWALPCTLAKRGNGKSIDGAMAFGLPTACDVTMNSKRLHDVIADYGIDGFALELAPHYIFNSEHIDLGTRGVRNLLIHLKMLEGEIEIDNKVFYANDDTKEDIIIAKAEGLIYHQVAPGDEVKKGDSLALIRSIETMDIIETVYAPFDGYIYWQQPQISHSLNSNYVKSGDRVVLIKEEII